MADPSVKLRTLDQEHEVIPALRNDDAEWKVIQQNTFTRWVNNHLKNCTEKIQNLETDFSDGLKLINLAKVLSHKDLGRFNKKVSFRSQKLENVSLALNFFQDVEKIKIINIDSSHIVDQNKKLILGLIWTLILHYSISMGWTSDLTEGQNDDSPKQKLLSWLRSKLPGGMPLTNFTSDWNDGIALAALVDSLLPGSLSDWQSWHPANAERNTERAMEAAQKGLGVEPLISPSEIIHPEVDDLSVMTYLSQFPTACQPSLPPRPLPVASPAPTVTGRLTDVDRKQMVAKPTEFGVIIQGENVKPKIGITDSTGTDVHHTMNKIDENSYAVKFTPSKAGNHKIALSIRDMESGDSIVVPEATTILEVVPRPYMKEYPEKVTVGTEVPFRIENAVGATAVEAVIVDSQDREHRVPVIGFGGNSHGFEYSPAAKGLHSVNVFYNKEHIDGSPFPLRVFNKIPELSIWGRGLAQDGIRVGDQVPVNVELEKGAGYPGALEAVNVMVTDKATGFELPVSILPISDKHVCFLYSPERDGDLEVEVNYEDEGAGESPYKVNVSPISDSDIRAFGPGLRGGLADEQAVFQVNTKGNASGLTFSIEGPSKAAIECQDRGNGNALVAYVPTEPGVYRVNVLSGGEHIPESPFVLKIDPKNNLVQPSAARLSGLDPNKKNYVNHPVNFNIDLKRTHEISPPQVSVLDKQLNKVPLSLTETTPGVYNCEFVPHKEGPFYVDAAVKGVAVPGAPFCVNVREPVDLSRIRMFGPGIDGPVYSQEPTHFTIDAKQAGPGAVEVSLTDRNGENVDIDVLDNSDGSFTVKYTAPRPGAYQLNVIFAGEEIPPIEISVMPQVDLSGITVEGLENGEYPLGHRLRPSIHCGSIVARESGLQLLARINEEEYTVPLVANGDIHEGLFVATEPGTVDFSVVFDDIPIKNYRITVVDRQDASKCTAEGTELRTATIGEPARFNISTQGAGNGPLSVHIDGPTECAARLDDNDDGTYTVEFVPEKIGNHDIDIKFGDEAMPIPGSPFHCLADYPSIPSSVIVSELPEIARKNQVVRFTVDASKTKYAPVSCRLPAGLKEPVVNMNPVTRVHLVEVLAQGEAGDALPIDIRYDNSPVKGSPFYLEIGPEVEPKNIKITDLSNNHNKVAASTDAELNLDTRDCGPVKAVKVEVLGPDGIARSCSLSPTDDSNVYQLSIPTDMAGYYIVDVYLDGKKADRAVINALATGKIEDVQVEEDPRVNDSLIELEKPSKVVFSRPVGDAKLQAFSRKPDMAAIDVHSDIVGDRVLDTVAIAPLKEGPNTVVCYYGGVPVKEIHYEAVPASQLVVNKPEKKAEAKQDTQEEKDPLFTREFKFNLDNSVDVGLISAVVKMPSNKNDQAEIIDNADGSILVKYTPKKFGQHELSIFQDGAQVQGTPVRFFVDSYGDGFATVYGPGLQNGVVGEPAAFTVCAKGSHAKELSVSIEGPAQSTIKIHDNKDGTCSVTWVPPVPGEYKVHVKLGSKEVRDSPFTVLIAGEGQKRSHLSMGSTSEVALNIANTELTGISASIKSPSGIEEPCFVRMIDGGRLGRRRMKLHKPGYPVILGVSFTPREVGEHLITVKRNGKLVPKAPFKIKVEKSQVGDAGKVEVSGDGKTKAICLQDNELLVDTSKAGYGGLSVSVQGPSKAELTCKEVKSGLIKVNYRPTEPGIYAIAVKFADNHIKDSPFTVVCTGKGAGRVQQEIKKNVTQQPLALPNQDSYLFLKLPNTAPRDISARLMDPKGKTDDIEMRDIGETLYQIKFRPIMEGQHALSVMHREAHVYGSPFQFSVGPFSEGGAHKVRASGMGVVRGETNLPQSFNIYSREAGPGALSVQMEGPSKAALEFKDHKVGREKYKVAIPGEYVLNVKFNNQHIADSPFKVFIAPATGEARKLELAQWHDNIPAGKAFTFTVLTHRARGHLEGKIVTPSNETETLDIVPIEEGEAYAMRFVPKETGNHYVQVTLDGAPMRDSPFRLRVGGSEMSDPTAITASGEGLVRGITGQKSEFIISTVNAGAGTLTTQVDGPSKVTLDVYELDLGYKVRFTPLAPGDYYAAVKYNGVHIPGSPFKIPVEGKVLGGNGYNETSFVKIDAHAKTSKGTVASVPEYTGDATKVIVKGAGLNKFFPGRPSVFTIDTNLAGPNILMVGVVTTKGPCEEVIVKHQGNGQYIVNYKIHDRVRGFVFVKYGDKEVPGSPFAIAP